MEEFVSNEDFANIFLKAANVRGAYKIEEVIHSKTDAELGESDIVLVLNINNKKHAIHIEDKIDAIAMPEQHDRYDKRAEKDIANGEYDSYSVIIVAPEKYLAKNEESKKYANKVTYEEMLRCFLSKGDLRSKYKIALIEKAIDDQKKADIKAEKHRAELRRDPSSQLRYRAEYWVRRNRENLWEEFEGVNNCSQKVYKQI